MNTGARVATHTMARVVPDTQDLAGRDTRAQGVLRTVGPVVPAMRAPVGRVIQDPAKTGNSVHWSASSAIEQENLFPA